MDVQLKRGYIEICVLASMLKEETYGYKLIKDVSEHMEISESTLYPILKRLEASGSVKVRSEEFNSRIRKYYAITNEGKKRIKEFLQDIESVRDICDYIKKEYENDKNRIY